MQAMVVYASDTGNTQKIATAIFAAIPGESKDMQRIEEYRGKDADIFFIGFCTKRGSCDPSIAELLEGLHDKKVALFATCGAAPDDFYYESILRQVRGYLPADNTYLGDFICQGKMPMQVRRRYETMVTTGADEAEIQRMLRNFDRALLHPDRQDEEEAAGFARRIMEGI